MWGTSVICHVHLCVFGPPEYTSGRMVASLWGPEEDASCWPKKLSTLWWPMIEAGNMLQCLLVKKRLSSSLQSKLLNTSRVNFSSASKYIKFILDRGGNDSQIEQKCACWQEQYQHNTVTFRLVYQILENETEDPKYSIRMNGYTYETYSIQATYPKAYFMDWSRKKEILCHTRNFLYLFQVYFVVS